MALVVMTLEADLLATFLAMDNMQGDGNKYMADNVAKNIKNYILTGQTPKGTMAIDELSLSFDLYATFLAINSDDNFAERIATDIDKSCSSAGFSGTKSIIAGRLKSCFKSMVAMTNFGNEYFASELAAAVDAYLKAGTVYGEKIA